MAGERIFRILYLPVMYSGLDDTNRFFCLAPEKKEKKLFLTILEGLA